MREGRSPLYAITGCLPRRENGIFALSGVLEAGQNATLTEDTPLPGTDPMNTYFAIAAVFSLFVTGVHFFLGGKQIARPLLEAKTLPNDVRCVQYFCWHITTLSLLLQAILFGIAAAYPAQLNLAIVAAAFAGSIAALGILMPPALKTGYGTMPQGLLFVPITALGLAGILAA